MAHDSERQEDIAPRRGLVLLGILFAVVLAGIDGTVVGVVMPVAVNDLGGDALYAWAFAAYMLATAVTMPAWGPGSDRWGRRRTFLAGLGVFVAGSILCALAPTMPLFIGARVVQGIGAGAIFSVPFVVLAVVYPPERRARALGVIASAWGLSSVLGPVLGTAIIANASWRWVFLMNVPAGVLATFLILRGMRESVGERRGRFDVVGSLLAGLGAAALIFAFVRMGEGVVGLAEGTLVVLGLALLAAFVLNESRVTAPVLPLEFFKRRGFTGASFASLLAAFSAFGIVAFLPLEVARLFEDTGAVGVVVAAFSLGWSGASLTSGRFVHRFGERVFVLAGMLLHGAGLVALSLTVGSAGLASVAAAAALTGLGMGVMTPALTVSVQNAVEVRRVGAATGGQQFMRQLGSALGVGTMGLVYHTAGFGAGTFALLAAVGVGFMFGILLPSTSLAAPAVAPLDATQD